MRCIFFIVLSFFCLNTHGLAQDQQDAEQMVQSRLDAVFSVLQTQNLSLKEKSGKIDEIVSPMFDFRRMAMLSVGKKYWPGLGREKQERFTTLFVKHLKDSYRDKLMLYTDEEVVYEPPFLESGMLRIPTYLVSKDSRISVLYKLYRTKGVWKIYDIEVKGVSIIQTYRSQFYQDLKNGAFDDLLLKLNKPVDS